MLTLSLYSLFFVEFVLRLLEMPVVLLSIYNEFYNQIPHIPDLSYAQLNMED